MATRALRVLTSDCDGLQFSVLARCQSARNADSALSAAAHPQDTVARRSSRSARIGLALFPLTRAGLPLRSRGRRDAAAARWGIAKSLDTKRCIGSAC